MADKLTVVIERDGDWYIGFCPQVPGANGQGRTEDECRESLAEALKMILKDRSASSSQGPRPFGLSAGDFTVADDFDAPLPDDMLKQFEGE
jgi:predicted RNase H-like HicB family nuclease